MKNSSRREFLINLGATACALSFSSACQRQAESAATPRPAPIKAASGHPARFWHVHEDRLIQCELCPHECLIKPNETGFCRVRKNIDGNLLSLVYSQPVTWHNDPIEKKPLNHVLPGSLAFSLATVGCNMICKHCQNWQLSQSSPGDIEPINWTPRDLAVQAKANRSATIAFTYNEPSIWPEYILDTCEEAQKVGLRTLIISNGFINETPQRELAKKLVAYKVDLKGFSEKFYQSICHAQLKPVLDGMVRIKQEGCWLEIVALIIPTLNDNSNELKQLAQWVNANLGPDVPVHFTRFHPMFQLRNLPRTPVSTLETAHKIAKDEGLHYVYIGNVPGHDSGNTYCHSCGELLIKRYGFSPTLVGLNNGTCRKCNTKIPGVWS